MADRRPGPKPVDPSIRFWAKVDRENHPGGCWIWLGGTCNGYGWFFVGSGRRQVYAHRWAWEDANGEIPEGLEVDHLCRERRCVRPSHLDVVTSAENHGRSIRARRAWAIHGTTGKYGQGCRCSLCRQWSRENARRLRAKSR
jgi:hypothetical protein